MRKSLNNKIFIIILASLALRSALFGYLVTKIPSAKFMPDTPTYIEPGINLIEKGVFGTYDDNGQIRYEVIRTPGYPIFIAILCKVLGLSFDSIVLVQILLITLAGYVTYRAAYDLDRSIALLAAIIFLFDLPTTIASLMLLSEALHTFFIACFIYLFLRYLRETHLSFLLLSILMLVIATFIRPISYYLGVCLALGVIYVSFRRDPKKTVAHALILLILFYAPLGLWQYRNYARTRDAAFSTIATQDLNSMGLTHKYEREMRSDEIKMSPFLYYVNHAGRSMVQFFTIPGTLKYLRSEPLKVASKIYGYPWVVFWLMGLVFARFDKIPNRFLISTILYYMIASIVVTGLCVGSRFRVPVMPLISILSASGWMRILNKSKE